MTERIDLTTPEHTGTLADRVLAHIQAAIVEGELAPGTKLAEPELARAYGISRGPLREAIRQLLARRLVELTPHAGARVIRLSRDQLIEIYEAREALEGMAARLAAERMADAEITALREVLERHESYIEDQEGRAYFQQEGDLDFHYRIARGSGNAVLNGILCDDLYHLMRMYRFRYSSNPGRPSQALGEHRRILEAVAERDAELAEALMRRHIRRARQNIETKEEARDE